jgi:hypothetical protein
VSESGVEAKRRWGFGQIAGRVVFLLVAFVSLYLLWPSLGQVFDQWRSLTELKPQWVLVALGVEALSFVAAWELQRIALQTKRWFPVAMSQLAGNAFGRSSCSCWPEARSCSSGTGRSPSWGARSSAS